MKIKKILLALALGLGVLSLVNVPLELLPNRWLRLLTSILNFLLAINIVGLKKIWGLSTFGLLIICDFLLLKWEGLNFKYAYYALHSLLILFLILMTIRGMKWRKISWFEVGSTFLFLIFSSFTFLALREFFYIGNIPLNILFNVNGFFMVTLLVLSFFNSLNDDSFFSVRDHLYIGSYFFWGVLSLTISDLIMFIIYFLDAHYFRYLDNIFYVVGLYFLLKVSLEHKLLQQIGLNFQEEGEMKVEDSNKDCVYR